MLFAMLEIGDFTVIGLLVLVFAGGSRVVIAQMWPAERDRLARIEQKLDLLLNDAGLDYTPPVKAAWQALADEGPNRKIAAIKAYRNETGAGLADAKRVVEGYIEGRQGSGESGAAPDRLGT